MLKLNLVPLKWIVKIAIQTIWFIGVLRDIRGHGAPQKISEGRLMVHHGKDGAYD